MSSGSVPVWKWISCRSPDSCSKGVLNYEECQVLNEALEKGIHSIYFELNGELVVIQPFDSNALQLRAAPIDDPEAPHYILSKDVTAGGTHEILGFDDVAEVNKVDKVYGDGSSIEQSQHAPYRPETPHSGNSHHLQGTDFFVDSKGCESCKVRMLTVSCGF